MPKRQNVPDRTNYAAGRRKDCFIAVTCAEIEQSAHKRGSGTALASISAHRHKTPLCPGLQLIKHGSFRLIKLLVSSQNFAATGGGWIKVVKIISGLR